MIVKDEAVTLAEAIQSTLPVVDEVVIGVDRSCTDETPAIARQFASPGKYFEFTWRDDFAGARNEAIKRASGDLIFILDGHEGIPPDSHPIAAQLARMRGLDIDHVQVPTPLTIFSTIRHDGIPDGYDVVCLTLAMNNDAWGIPQLFFLQPRIFRNNGEIRYQNTVHNALRGYKNERAMAYPEGILLHNMPPKREEQRKKQRGVMNFQGLLADVRQERAKPLAEQDGRPFFYLGNSHADLGRSGKAIHWYREYLKRSRFGEEKYQALQQLAILSHRHTKDIPAAQRYALEALMLQWRRAEPAVLLGEIAATSGDFEQAIHWFTVATEYQAPPTVMFLQGAVYSYLPDVQRAKCAAQMGDWPMAMGYLEQALTWRPGDADLVRLHEEFKEHLRREKSKPNFLLIDRLGSFSTDIAQHFANRDYTVIRQTACDMRWKGWADVTWFEWCDENLIEWSRYSWDGPVICRLHSYEAFGDVPEHVNWGNVTHLIFVAEHIRDLFQQKWPQIAAQVPSSVIPNGVKLEGLTYRDRTHGKRIGYLGYLNHKKGVDILVQAIRVLPEFEFHIAGQFQDPHLGYYFDHAIQDLPNVWWHGWVDPAQKDEWLETVDYLISPSIVESFGYSIAEAMAKGIKPLIHERPGAIWPETWRSVNDLRNLLAGPYESANYRKHIEDNYSVQKQMAMTEALVNRLRLTQKYGAPIVEGQVLQEQLDATVQL